MLAKCDACHITFKIQWLWMCCENESTTVSTTYVFEIPWGSSVTHSYKVHRFAHTHQGTTPSKLLVYSILWKKNDCKEILLTKQHPSGSLWIRINALTLSWCFFAWHCRRHFEFDLVWSLWSSRFFYCQSCSKSCETYLSQAQLRCIVQLKQCRSLWVMGSLFAVSQHT